MSKHPDNANYLLRKAREATAKADNFSLQNDSELRLKAKQAIIQELKTQLEVKAQKLHIGSRSAAGDHTEGDKNNDVISVGVGLDPKLRGRYV